MYFLHFQTVLEQKKFFILIFSLVYSHSESDDAKNYIQNFKKHSPFFPVRQELKFQDGLGQEKASQRK